MRLLVVLAGLTFGGGQEPEATLTGTVTTTRRMPPAKQVPLPPGCEKVSPEGVPNREDLVVDAQGRLRWAIVYVTKGLQGPRPAPPEGPARLRLRGHRFEPRVLAVRTGQKLVVSNEDDHAYNAHGLAVENREFNVGLSKKGVEAVRTFDRPEIFRVKDG
jgi:hypothetical protein